MTNQFAIWTVAFLFLAGCGGSDGTDGGTDVEQDAGWDAGGDAGQDAGYDAGYDAGQDAGQDAGEDAGQDAGYDAGYDAGQDAGEDGTADAGQDADGNAGCTRDPRISSDPDPDEIYCGDQTCHPSTGEVCCVSMSGMTCKAASDCTGFSAPAYCDGPEDCPEDMHCCVGFPSGASCSRSACSGNTQELCNCEEDCAPGHCTACSAPGAGSLVYGLCTSDGQCPSPYTEP